MGGSTELATALGQGLLSSSRLGQKIENKEKKAAHHELNDLALMQEPNMPFWKSCELHNLHCSFPLAPG